MGYCVPRGIKLSQSSFSPNISFFFFKCLQILLDDVKVSEQLLDLVFYLLIVLGHYRQVVFSLLFVPFIFHAMYQYLDLFS